jgi:putative membrane protein
VSYLLSNWSWDPFFVIAVAVGLAHEAGLRHLAARSQPARTWARRKRSFAFYGGLCVLLVTVQSPIDYWSDYYYWVHMVQHLLLMLLAPTLVVAGAPWLPLLHALPVRVRRAVLRGLLISSWARPLRAAGRFVTRPWFAVVSFNVAMLIWHVPALFDLAYRNQTVHIWLMHGSFFVTGVLFWLQFIPSYPFRRTLGPPGQICALLLTNLSMFVLAISQSVFAPVSWYPVYSHLPGVRLSPVASQQIGAGILWVCGDVWCYPAIVVAVRRLMERDGLEGALDRFLRREARTTELARRGTSGQGP